jgi:hypothetical protein
MPTTDELRAAHESGRHMREAHKDRKAPMYEMGPDGHELRKAWLAGRDCRDGEIKRIRAA